ncbi:permease-like cell division protein FtsX [uncultured Flavonifractor sp.]|uniref:permease-like cell division protein FtsX n=1 Tax=uncultured Flavonifractor sp. TaxID=1193534 RepID=UPI00260597BD|nr:permease-like cell division protein FtsX [uncultured Flavonifractor sp.]
MKQRYDFGYFFVEGFRSIFTHGLMSFAAVCMIICCLLIMGSFSLVAVNASNMFRDLEKENQFTAYIEDTLTQEEARGLEIQIEDIPNVARAEFVTKEEAQAEFEADYEGNPLFEGLPAEVYRDRFHVYLDDISRLAETEEAVNAVAGVAWTKSAPEIAEGFTVIRNVAGAVAVILVIILLAVSLFIIANTIKLATFNRREEIAIMKMCGATNSFVRWPFVFEGLILGLVGAAVAFFLEWGVYVLVSRAISTSDTISLITVLPFQPMALRVLGVFALTGFVIGAGGSVLAIRKFLQV